MKQNKSQLKRQERRRYKQQAKDASDIFELNSPMGVGYLDSALQERLNVVLHRYKEYGLRSERLSLGVLPYVVAIIERVGALELRMPLEDYLVEGDSSGRTLFEDILRIERIFGSPPVVDWHKGSSVNLNRLNLRSQTRLMNVELAVNDEFTVDLSFDLPDFLIEPKDYLNYAYFMKRGALVVDLYNKLLVETSGRGVQGISEKDARRACEKILGMRDIPTILPTDQIQDVRVEVDYLHDLRYLPVISVLVVLRSDNEYTEACVSQCRFRIKPSIPEGSGLSMDSVRVYRNCVRMSVWNHDTFSYDKDQLNSCFLPPTPQYNGAVLSETRSRMLRESQIAERILSSSVFEEALMLLKLWCIRWRVWSNMRVDSRFRLSGQLDEEVVRCLLFHTLEVNRDVLESRKTTSFQVFRLVLTTLNKMILNWRSRENDPTGTYYVFGDLFPRSYERTFLRDKDFKMTNMLHLFNRDYIGSQVFILTTDEEDEAYNVFWRCQDLVKEELLGILDKTLALIENKTMLWYVDSVSDMFSLGREFDQRVRLQSHDKNKSLNDTPLMLSLLEFDSCILVSYPHSFDQVQLSYLVPPDNGGLREISLGNCLDPKKSPARRGFDSVWENCPGSNLVEITRRILARGFTDRVKNLHFREISSKDRFGCLVGIQFVSRITRSIDKGPFVDTSEAKEFKNFWGSDKVETRRFKDGTILETVVWNNESGLNGEFLINRGINQEILKYVLARHLPKIKFEPGSGPKTGVITYSMTPFGSVGPYTSWEKDLHKEFSEFKSVITGLTSLPLSIKSIQSSSPSLRFMKFCTHLAGSGITGEDQLGGEEIHCVVEMEQSNQWPKTRESIRKIKIAFLLSIQKELGELHSITCDIIPEYDYLEGTDNPDLRDFAPFLDIFWKEEITFRLSIFHQAELEQVAKTTIELENISDKVIEENTKSPREGLEGEGLGQLRNLWWKTQTGARLLNLSNYFPSFRETVKKLKHFVSVNRVPDSEELLEHVAAYVYTSNDLLNCVYDLPSTSTTGFLRSLWLISRFEWEKKPLIVDLDFQMTEDSEKKRMSTEDFEKLDHIHSVYYNFVKKHKLPKKLFFVSSLYDPQSLLIKLPSYYNSNRLIHFAKLYTNIIVHKHSFNLPIKEINSSLMAQPKSDVVIHLERDFVSLVQPQSKKAKFNSFSLKKKYVNLSSTQELLSCSKLKGSPHHVAREVFESFVSQVKSLWNHQVDLIYDPFVLPYPDKIYLKVRNSQFYPSKATEHSKNFLPSCTISLPLNTGSQTACSVFVIPNLPLILGTIWNRYSGLVTDIQL